MHIVIHRSKKRMLASACNKINGTKNIIQSLPLNIGNDKKFSILASTVLLTKQSADVANTSNREQHIQIRPFGHRSRGSRGHGWLKKYRDNKGGRHLQGRYHKFDADSLKIHNDTIFELGTSECFLDIQMDDDDDDDAKDSYEKMKNEGESEKTKRIVIELASEALPKTCHNFLKLCQDGYYNDTKVFKIERNVGLCMGDVLDMDGRGGKCHPETSSSGYFENEGYYLSHAQKGVLTMLAPSVDKNDSRFMITLRDTPQLDGRYVAFGRLKEDENGIKVLENIVENTYTRRGKPQKDIKIISSGVF